MFEWFRSCSVVSELVDVRHRFDFNSQEIDRLGERSGSECQLKCGSRIFGSMFGLFDTDWILIVVVVVYFRFMGLVREVLDMGVNISDIEESGV